MFSPALTPGVLCLSPSSPCGLTRRRSRRPSGPWRSTRRWSSPASATCSRSGWPGCARQGVRPAGRRLRRDLRLATADNIRDRIKTILQMAACSDLWREHAVVKVGRIAGQFAKPRSSDTETARRPDTAYLRGDHGQRLPVHSRVADPRSYRLVRAYNASSDDAQPRPGRSRTGGSPPAHVHDWNRGFVRQPANSRTSATAGDIDKAMKFMAACGADFDALRTVEFFASHEALLLDYERPLTRIDSRTGLAVRRRRSLRLVGERTRDLDGAHIDFVSRIRNPIGVKLGPRPSRLTSCAHRQARPRTRARAADVHHPDGRRHGPRGAALRSWRRSRRRARW
jgi:hypothetical protein